MQNDWLSDLSDELGKELTEIKRDYIEFLRDLVSKIEDSPELADKEFSQVEESDWHKAKLIDCMTLELWNSINDKLDKLQRD